MNLDKAIRTGIIAALAGLQYDGKDVLVVDGMAFPEEGLPYPYILVSAQTHTQRSTKGRRPFDATAQLDVVTGFLSPEGRDVAEDIEEAATALICPDNRQDMDITANGWEIGDTTILNSTDFNNKNDIYYVFRKTTVFGFIVSKV